MQNLPKGPDDNTIHSQVLGTCMSLVKTTVHKGLPQAIKNEPKHDRQSWLARMRDPVLFIKLVPGVYLQPLL